MTKEDWKIFLDFADKHSANPLTNAEIRMTEPERIAKSKCRIQCDDFWRNWNGSVLSF